MAIRVLIVDDSGFFRRRVSEILTEDPMLEVVGMATNGQEAIEKTLELRPDVITMDIEMPVMDGIQATRKIMAQRPTPIIMFSSLTTDGAKATLDALEAGALDFLPKRFEDISSNKEEAKHMLCQRVRGLAQKRPTVPHVPPVVIHTAVPRATPVRNSTPVAAGATPHVETGTKTNISLVAIGTSTGGPIALQKVLTSLPANFPVPIILVQHMPASFTGPFAQRLDSLCQITVKEAVDGDVLKPGTALLAPGGKQMLITGRAQHAVIKIEEGDPSMTYRPCVDLTFDSIARVFPGHTLGIIMTGMGADGREGSRALKQGGSIIWAQDEASCVVYGMPAAVADAKIAERMVSLDDIGPSIVQRV